MQGISAQLTGGVDLLVDLPSLVQWYLRHLCLIEGGRSAKFGVLVFKATMLD